MKNDLLNKLGKLNPRTWLIARVAGILLVLGVAAGYAYLRRADWQPLLIAWLQYERFAQSDQALASAAPGTEFQDCAQDGALCPVMVVIPEGTVVLGAVDGDRDASADESPRHTLTIGRFAASRTEITVANWQACVRALGCEVLPASSDERPEAPAAGVSWADAQAYVRWLSRMTGQDYRLLREAEWEYAARGQSGVDATASRFGWGDALGPARYLASEIFLPAQSEAEFTAQVNAANTLINTMRGGVPFPTTARQHSGAPSAENGGDRGWITPADLAPELRPIAEQLRAGQVSLPVPASTGVYILALREVRAPSDDPVCETDAQNGASFFGCDQNRAWPVASFQPNSFGLYDMHGNAWEWVEDCYAPYEASPATDPTAQDGGERACLTHVLRGGSWDSPPSALRSSNRAAGSSRARRGDTGFRVARSA